MGNNRDLAFAGNASTLDSARRGRLLAPDRCLPPLSAWPLTSAPMAGRSRSRSEAWSIAIYGFRARRWARTAHTAASAPGVTAAVYPHGGPTRRSPPPRMKLNLNGSSWYGTCWVAAGGSLRSPATSPPRNEMSGSSSSFLTLSCNGAYDRYVGGRNVRWTAKELSTR